MRKRGQRGGALTGPGVRVGRSPLSGYNAVLQHLGSAGDRFPVGQSPPAALHLLAGL